jgi:hypothetical protein
MFKHRRLSFVGVSSNVSGVRVFLVTGLHATRLTQVIARCTFNARSLGVLLQVLVAVDHLKLLVIL